MEEASGAARMPHDSKFWQKYTSRCSCCALLLHTCACVQTLITSDLATASYHELGPAIRCLWGDSLDSNTHVEAKKYRRPLCRVEFNVKGCRWKVSELGLVDQGELDTK